jgi:O-antigen ligase/tetratricopeptide (TPR) repeat protein
MEAVVLLTVVLSPWAFGCVHPLSQLFLAGSLGVLLALWAVRIVVEGRLRWASCPVFLCLGGLFLLGVVQIAPLSLAALEVLSPATAELRRDLLPTSREQVTAAETPAADEGEAGQTISFYPGATRMELLGWLALITLFAVVRTNLASAESLRRLAVAAVVNGALLALFGLLQFFSSSRHVLYWSVPSDGAVFGPFINRNHFACHINLCIGLGVGLLLYLRPSPDGARVPGRGKAGSPGGVPFLLRPQTLSVGLALALMLASVAICLSRGALLALAAAGLVCLVLSCRRSGQPPRVWGAALVAAAAVALVCWLALPAVQARLDTLWRGEALQDGRLELWTRVLPLWREFPVWGTGYGTFAYVEPLARAPGQGRNLVYDYADNDYVQLLVEGGGVGLVLAILAAALVYYLGGRAALTLRSNRTAGLVLGGIFAWTTVTVHSFFGYGLHVPAVTVLATVIAAQLSAVRVQSPAPAPDALPIDESARRPRWRWLAPALGVLAVTTAAFVLMSEAWRAARVERYRLAAQHCETLSDPAAQERRRTYLHAAVALAPDNALLRLALAETYHDAFERRDPAPRRHTHGQTGNRDLQAALTHFLQARDLCPLLGTCHVRLASYAATMARADTPDVYLRRAARLMPADERIWFVCGARALDDGRPEKAWSCWRRSLECSPRYLRPVVVKSCQRLAAAEVVSKVLPADALLLCQAALVLSELPDAAAVQQVFLDAAVHLFEQQPGAMSGDAWYTRARCHCILGQTGQALESYREALTRHPDKTVWRYECIQLLVEAGQLPEARRELLVLLQQEPNNTAARDLYQKVLQRTADGD